MTKRFCRLAVAAALGGLLSAGCRTASTKDERSGASADSASAAEAASDKAVERRAKAHAHYASAVVYELQGEKELALKEFYEAAAKDPENEELLLEVTRKLLQARQSGRALELLLPASRRPTVSGEVLARLSFVYSQQGQAEQALEAARRAVMKSPESLVAYQNLFLSFLHTKQPDAALKMLDGAAKRPEADADFLIGVGELYVNYALQFPSQRETVHAKALDVLARAEAMRPASGQLRLRLADCFHLAGGNDQAARLYLDLIKLPGNLPLPPEVLRAKLADIYLRDRDPKRAAEQLEQIVREDPSNSQAYYFLGSIAYEEKRWKDMADYLRKVVVFSPDFEQAYYDLASAQLALGENEQALATLATASKKFSRGFVMEYLLGMANAANKDFTNAVTHYTAAEGIGLTADTNRLNHVFYFQFGAACERKGDRAQAEKCFEKSLSLNPEYDEAKNYLGYMWAERGENLERAKELIEQAVKAEPDNEAYLDSMGWVLFKLGQTKEALDYLLKAVAAAKEPDETLYEHLGDIYAALGETDKARDAWRKSLEVENRPEVRKKLEAPKAD